MPVPNVGVKTYDPKMVVVNFGTLASSGYAQCTFIRVSRSGDAFAQR